MESVLLSTNFPPPGLLMDMQRLKQDLLIAVMCVFMVLLIVLIIGGIFLHFRLNDKDRVLEGEVKSYAIQTHCVKTKIVLSPSQTHQFVASKWKATKARSQLLLPQSPVVSQLTPCEQPTTPCPHPVAAEPPEQCDPPTPNPSKRSITHIYQSYSSESIISEDWGSIYSLDHFQSLYSSSWSDSRESPAEGNFPEDELGGSDESGSMVLCAVHLK